MKKLSGFTLKWIAIISMIIAIHFGSIIMDGVIEPYKVNDYIMFTSDMPFMVRNAFQIKNICEILGRVAFPIFCFLIVEGFIYTRNRLKYAIRIGIFALISEIPFNLAHYNKLFGTDLQNVLFTLFIGVLTLIVLDMVISNFRLLNYKQRIIKIFLSMFVISSGMVVAFLIRSEYVFLGILIISLIYLFRKNRYMQLIGILPLIIISPWVLLAIIPIVFYNGLRGKGLKYFFYIFYPTHFLLLAGMWYLLANRKI